MKYPEQKNLKELIQPGSIVRIKDFIENSYYALINLNKRFADLDERNVIYSIFAEVPMYGEMRVSASGWGNIKYLFTDHYLIEAIYDANGCYMASLANMDRINELETMYKNYPTHALKAGRIVWKYKPHIIKIDDKEIEISEESYNKLKESLV